jgi:signal transduction histidine kinase
VLVSDLSHELRTLLGGIIGLNELLLSTELSHHQKQLSQTIDSSSKTLLTVLNDIVDLSRIEVGKMSIVNAPLNFPRLIEEVVALSEPAATSKQLELQVEAKVPPLLIGDATRLRQLFSSLTLRLIKSTEKGVVRLKVHVDENSALLVDVESEQIGQFDRVWLKALSEPAPERAKHDSGWLTLYICHCLVKMMGGECGTELSDNGCRLWARIPVTVPSGLV